MNKQYRLLVALTFFVGVLCSLGQGVTAPISLVTGVSEIVVEQMLIGALFFLFTLLTAKVIKIEFIHGYIERTLKVKVPNLIGDIGSGTIIFIGSCLILSLVFKQNISALLVTGAGSAAILGFALKDFAVALASGITFNFEDSFKVGDRIRVMVDKDGHEGIVQRITWRNTVLLTDHLQTVFIPNVRLSAATIINYDLPDRSNKRLLRLVIDYDVSVESVERVLYAGVLNAVGVKFTAPPVVRATGLKESGVEYLITYTIADMRDRLPAEHAIMRSVLESMRVANISIARSNYYDTTARIANRSLDLYHLVQQVKLFAGLDEDIARNIVNLLESQRYAPSSIIVYGGERDDALFIVAEGILSRDIVDKDGISKQRFIATEFFGVEALFLNVPHQANVTANTDALVYKLSKQSLRKLLEQNPNLIGQLSNNLAKYYGEDNQDLPFDGANSLAYRRALYEGIIDANYSRNN